METSRLARIQADLKYGLQTEKQLDMNWYSKPCSCEQFRLAGTQQEAPVIFASNLCRGAVTAGFIFPIYKDTYPAGAATCQKAVWGGTVAIHPLLWAVAKSLLPPKANSATYKSAKSTWQREGSKPA